MVFIISEEMPNKKYYYMKYILKLIETNQSFSK